MPTYKLTYFNITGRAEVLRYMFHYAGIKFEDVRLNLEDWPKHKAEMPMRQVPVLEIDGKKYTESKAIGRYIAKQCNLYSSDDIEALEIDAVVDAIDDARKIGSHYYWAKDPAIKEYFKSIVIEKIPFFLDKFEEQVKKNGGYFVGGKLSWADVVYAAFNESLLQFTKNLEGTIKMDYPELKKLTNKVNAIPSIKAYRDKRPKTIY